MSTPNGPSRADAGGASEARRLYGVPDAEHLFDDPAGAYELQVEPYADEHDRRPRVIEEWTVHPPHYHLPSTHRVIEWLHEWASDQGELTEDASDHLERSIEHADVHAAAEALLDAVAARMTYWMADRRVAEHTITWDDSGKPLLDGERLYRPVAEGDPAASQKDRTEAPGGAS